MREFINIINEATLEEAGAGPARITSHIRKGTPFFMISAMRADEDVTKNKKRAEILRNQLAKAPSLSFVDMSGEYHEDGQDQPTRETSFFVMPRSKGNIDKFIALGVKLRDVFDQDAIIAGDGEEIKILGKGWSEDLGDTATFDPAIIDTLPGWSAIKNRRFSFMSNDKDVVAKYGSGKDEKKPDEINPWSYEKMVANR